MATYDTGVSHFVQLMPNLAWAHPPTYMHVHAQGRTASAVGGGGGVGGTAATGGGAAAAGAAAARRLRPVSGGDARPPGE